MRLVIVVSILASLLVTVTPEPTPEQIEAARNRAPFGFGPW